MALEILFLPSRFSKTVCEIATHEVQFYCACLNHASSIVEVATRLIRLAATLGELVPFLIFHRLLNIIEQKNVCGHF